MRVLGAAPHRLRTRLTCLAVDRHGYTVTVEVDVRQNKEHWSLPFSSYYFNCLLRGNFKPSQVAVQQEGHPNTQNSWIKVKSYQVEGKVVRSEVLDAKKGLIYVSAVKN